MASCSHLLLCCRGPFACFCRVYPLVAPLFSVNVFAICLVRFWLGPCLLALLCLRPCVIASLRAWPLPSCGLVVLVFLPARLLVSFRGRRAPFCVWWAPLCLLCLLFVVGTLPGRLLLPFPLRLVPCGALVQFVRWSLPLGIWWRPGCPALMLGVWSCSVVLTSLCLMAAKAFGPVWGALPSTPCCRCCSGAQFYHAEVFICDDPGPPLDTAKLRYCYSWL